MVVCAAGAGFPGPRDGKPIPYIPYPTLVRVVGANCVRPRDDEGIVPYTPNQNDCVGEARLGGAPQTKKVAYPFG